MTSVILTVGLPASGKTTYARQLVAESGGRLRRVNMDDLRSMLDNGDFSPEHESTALKMQDEIIVQSVKAGFDVIVDNTHINKRMPDRIRSALAPYKVTWRIADFRSVPVEECVRRDQERESRGERSVGRAVIERMARRSNHWNLTEDWLNEYPKPEKYKLRSIILPHAIICDLDGTLAVHQGRDPYDTARCAEDACESTIAMVLDDFHKRGVRVILVSGRDARFREVTKEWLHRYVIPYDDLYMRPEGDTRRDDVVKAELFDKHIRNDFNVLFCLDDRDRVVNMWRAMGLKTWQVAEGDF